MSETVPRHIEIVVPENQSPQRLDKYLSEKLAGKSRAYIQSLIVDAQVLVDGHQVKPSYKIAPSEKIDVHLKERPPADVLPENILLDIVYEDDALLVVNKPSGMVVHPAAGNYSQTLVNGLLFYCRERLSGVNGPVRPGIVHRLDKDTSGLLVVAKRDEAHAVLAKQFADKTAGRRYKALIWGHPSQSRQTVSSFLGRNPHDRMRMMVLRSAGKWAVTHIEIEARFRLMSLADLRLETGRTHQIRVHVASIGCPVVGDSTYGGRRKALTGRSRDDAARVLAYLSLMPRQALHAYELRFVHPTEQREMCFRAPLPDDFEALLSVVRAEETSV